MISVLRLLITINTSEVYNYRLKAKSRMSKIIKALFIRDALKLKFRTQKIKCLNLLKIVPKNKEKAQIKSVK